MRSYIGKKKLTFILAAVLTVMFLMLSSSESHATVEWYRFQNSDENNGVTPVEMAGSYDEAALKWGRQMVEGYTTSFTPPLIIDGYLYTASNKKIYKIDKETGDTVKTSAEMLVNVSYAMHPMTYSEETGCLYVPLLNGRVQCVDAETLDLKWISKTYTGTQALSPIAYKDGKIYTGIWSSEITDGVYFALDAETGETVWEFRPSELETVTAAEDLGEFDKPTGQTKPDNFYAYTALITVKPKAGFKFDKDAFGKYWLFEEGGGKYVPAGMDGASMVQSTVNGNSATYEYNRDGSVTIRVKFNCYQGEFTQTGSSDQQSSVMITGLDVPVVGQAFDTAAETDSNVTIESIEWKKGDIPHGFYWAGAYVNDDYLVFGSDDAQNNTFGESGASSYTGTSILYSLDRRTGKMVDKIEGCIGDIRSTIVYNGGYVYFTSKGGRLYKVKVHNNGTFDKSNLSSYEIRFKPVFTAVSGAIAKISPNRIYYTTNDGTGSRIEKVSVLSDQVTVYRVESYEFDDATGDRRTDQGIGMMTASPVIHNGRVYVGAAGMGGQFSADGGHLFLVLNNNNMLSQKSLAYKVDVQGYPQASPLLSTGASDGKVRLYFTFNAAPGGIYYLEDRPDATGEDHEDAVLLFRPEQAMREYCISPLCVDSDGTIYIKNDSGYLMAICVNKAYLPTLDPDNNVFGIRVTAGDEELEWDEPFTSGTLNYRLRAPNGTESADIQLDVPEGMTAAIDGNEYTGGKYTVPVSEDTSAITVTVSNTVLGKVYKRTYTLNIGAANNNANLAGLYINDSNTAPSFIVDYGDQHTNTKGIGFDPVFDAGTQKYVSRTYNGRKTFVNVWVKTDDPDATVKCVPVDGVGNVLAYTDDDGSIPNKGTNGNIRFPIYWIKGKISAEVKIVVTPPSGKEEARKEYNVELVRSEDNIDVGNDVLSLTVSSATLYTTGSDRSIQVKAMYGEKDVTKDCVWYSSRPDIATVDKDGIIAAQTKQGDAVIWACYGAQDTEDRPCVIRVRNADSAEPLSSLESGTYYTERKVELYTPTSAADIYYNIGEDGESVEKPDKNSTKYEGPLTLGEAGALKRYRIKAIAAGEKLSSSAVSDFDYVIDLRSDIAEVEISDLDAPLDEDITVSDGVTCEKVEWEKKDGAYTAKILLKPADASKYAFSKSMLVKLGDRYLAAEIKENGTAEVTAEFASSEKEISEVTLTGINWPEGLGGFDSSAAVSTDGAEVLKSSWTMPDGSDVPRTVQYNKAYVFKVVIGAKEGYELSSDLKVYVNMKGEILEAENVEASDDGTYTVTIHYTTDKLKADSSSGTCLTAETSALLEFDNCTPIDDIKRALNFSVTVKALVENGGEVEIPAENIYWDEDEIGKAYDPNAINECTFNAVGKVTLPEDIDPDGSSLLVVMPVSVRRGTVAVPEMDPAPGTYGAPQTVRLSSETRGAAIMFTRSDESGTFTYEEPLVLSGTSGLKVTYIFKMYATVNGVKSETVRYEMTIDRTPEAADADKNSKNKITPNEIAAAAAPEDKGIKKVSKITYTGNVSKKNMLIKFSKVSGALNYRVEYRKAGSKSWYYVWTKGKNSVSIGKLKKGTMYEFRIAPYKIVDGIWHRGIWSASSYQYLMNTTVSYKPGKKSFTTSVKKVKSASGYMVRYSLKKNMSGAKTKTFKGAKKTKLTVKKLKAKKTYYVQVCPYKAYGGKPYVGVWSAKKAVKTK